MKHKHNGKLVVMTAQPAVNPKFGGAHLAPRPKPVAVKIGRRGVCYFSRLKHMPTLVGHVADIIAAL